MEKSRPPGNDPCWRDRPSRSLQACEETCMILSTFKLHRFTWACKEIVWPCKLAVQMPLQECFPEHTFQHLHPHQLLRKVQQKSEESRTSLSMRTNGLPYAHAKCQGPARCSKTPRYLHSWTQSNLATWLCICASPPETHDELVKQQEQLRRSVRK